MDAAGPLDTLIHKSHQVLAGGGEERIARQNTQPGSALTVCLIKRK